MPKSSSVGEDRPIVSIGSVKILGLFGAFLAVVASGFLALVVWDEIDRHLEKIDNQLASLDVTQETFEQFLTSELPGFRRI